jgi:hypothetical protein
VTVLQDAARGAARPRRGASPTGTRHRRDHVRPA